MKHVFLLWLLSTMATASYAQNVPVNAKARPVSQNQTTIKQKIGVADQGIVVKRISLDSRQRFMFTDTIELNLEPRLFPIDVEAELENPNSGIRAGKKSHAEMKLTPEKTLEPSKTQIESGEKTENEDKTNKER